MKDKNEKIDYKNLNALIQTARVILKILLILALGGIVIFGFIVLEKTQILNILGTILSICMPLFLGFAIAWLFEPLIEKFEKKNFSRKISVLFTYLLFLLILVLLIVLVVPEFISQLKELISQIPSFLVDIKNFITNIFSKFSDSEIDITSIQNTIIGQIDNLANNITTNSLSGIIDTITKIFSSGALVTLGIIIGVYFSLDFDKIKDIIRKKIH